MENGGDGAAERSRKWSQAPGNIEDLGEHIPFRLTTPIDATNIHRQTSTLLCRSTFLPTETPRPPTPRMLRPTPPMLARASLGTPSGALATLATQPPPTPASSPRRCSRPTSSRVSPLTRLRPVASATVGTKSPPRRRTCSSSSSVSSLVPSFMVSLIALFGIAPWRISPLPLNGSVATFVLLLQALLRRGAMAIGRTPPRLPRHWCNLHAHDANYAQLWNSLSSSLPVFVTGSISV
jgi:hypothetical protein